MACRMGRRGCTFDEVLVAVEGRGATACGRVCGDACELWCISELGPPPPPPPPALRCLASPDCSALASVDCLYAASRSASKNRWLHDAAQSASLRGSCDVGVWGERGKHMDGCLGSQALKVSNKAQSTKYKERCMDGNHTISRQASVNMASMASEPHIAGSTPTDVMLERDISRCRDAVMLLRDISRCQTAATR
jgi:hypothetical protein